MNETGKTPTAEDYIQRFVCIHWFDDLRRIWLFNILQDVILGDFNINNFVADELVAPKTLLESVISDIYRLAADMRKKAIGIGDFCATKWFGDTSLMYWLNELQFNLQLPSLRQYTWLEFLCTFPYAMFIINLMVNIKRQDISMLGKNLLFELQQMQNQNITINIFVPAVRMKVQTLLNNTLEYAKHIRSL
jgi:hypothetical protein